MPASHRVDVSLEEVRSFWDRRPCNIRHSKRDVGTREYFDEVDRRRFFVEPHIIEFAEFERWGNKTVLGVGCGIGTDMIRFLQAGAVYVGMDLSATSVAIATQRLKCYGHEALLLVSDCESIVLPSNTPSHFDLIYSFGVLHHTPDIRSALAAIRRVASPSTQFRFMVYAKNSWKNAMIVSGLDQPEAQFGCPIANTYDEAEIRVLLRETGWELESLQQDHIFPWQIERYVQYEYVKEPYFEAMPPAVFDALRKAFGWHLLVRARPI